jgi:hypothetical protein
MGGSLEPAGRGHAAVCRRELTIRQFLAAVVNDMTTAFPSYSHYFLNQYMPGNRPSQRFSGITKVSEAAERRRQGLRSICGKQLPGIVDLAQI